MEHKTFNIGEVKVLDGDVQGRVSMIVSVFNNVDGAKDRIMPGFFAKSLAAKLPKGVWMHDWKMPVAKTLEARELLPGDPLLPDTLKGLGGLWIDSQFNMDTQRGRDAYSDVKGGFVDEFSIGFRTEKCVVDEKSGVRDLIEGKLYEWSPVLVGCNPLTAVLDVKSVEDMTFTDTLESVLPLVAKLVEKARSKAEFRATEGRKLSAATVETLGALAKQLDELADGSGDEPEGEPKAEPEVPEDDVEAQIALIDTELALMATQTQETP